MEAAHNMSAHELLQEYNNEFRMTVMPVTVFFGIEAFFGIIGNLLTLYVFFFHYKMCNFRYFVLCLALIDFSGCLTSIIGEMISQLFWYDYPWELLSVCKIKDFFNQFTICAEAGLLVVIAVDRYRKVCRPFGWQITEKSAKVLCFVIYVIASILATPAPILWGMHSDIIEYKGQNITITLCERDEAYRDTKLILANIVLNHSLIFLSMVCMVVMYIMVARTLIIGQKLLKKRPEQFTSSGTANESSTDCPSNESSPKTLKLDTNNLPEDDIFLDDKEQQKYVKKTTELKKMVKVRRKTVIMLYLTAIFVITTLIYSILIASVASGMLTDISGGGKAVYLLFLRFYFINHVINPVLYGIMDKQFRTEMSKIRSKIRGKCSKK